MVATLSNATESDTLHDDNGECVFEFRSTIVISWFSVLPLNGLSYCRGSTIQHQQRWQEERSRGKQHVWCTHDKAVFEIRLRALLRRTSKRLLQMLRAVVSYWIWLKKKADGKGKMSLWSKTPKARFSIATTFHYLWENSLGLSYPTSALNSKWRRLFKSERYLSVGWVDYRFCSNTNDIVIYWRYKRIYHKWFTFGLTLFHAFIIEYFKIRKDVILSSFIDQIRMVVFKGRSARRKNTTCLRVTKSDATYWQLLAKSVGVKQYTNEKRRIHETILIEMESPTSGANILGTWRRTKAIKRCCCISRIWKKYN